MKLATHSIVYLLSNIINAAIPFILLPILTRFLSPVEYGQIAMFQTLIAGLAAFIGLNTIGAVGRKYYDHGNTASDLSQYNGTCIQILILSTLLFSFICLIFSEKLVFFLAIPESWIYSALIFSALNFLVNLRLSIWQIHGKALKFGALQISNSLLNLVLSLLFVVSLKFGAQGRIDAQIIATILSAILACWLLNKDKLVTFWQLRIDYFKQALQFGIPLIPHVLGFFLLSAVDRFIINQKMGLGQAGIYMVAMQISMSLSIVFDAINKAYVPWLFNILKSDELDKKIQVVKYTYFYLLILLFLAPLPFFIGPWVLVLIVGEEYRSSGHYIGLLCLGQIFGGMYLMVTNYVFYAKRTGLLSLVTITSGIVNVILLILLVNVYGLLGASLAFVIAKFLQFIATWILAARVCKMPWLFIFKNKCI